MYIYIGAEIDVPKGHDLRVSNEPVTAETVLQPGQILLVIGRVRGG